MADKQQDLVDIVNVAGRNTAYSSEPDKLFLSQLNKLGYDVVPDDESKYPNGPEKPLFAPIPLDLSVYPNPGLIVPLARES